MPFKADKSNVGPEMLRWSLFKAAREFSVNEHTIGKKLAEAGELVGPDECFSTRQILRSLYGEIYEERLGKLKAEREQTELENAIMRGDYVSRVELLPGGQLLHRFDGERIHRVAWKIVRGLYFHHTGEVLRQDLVVSCTVTTPDDEKPPDHFIAFRDLPENPELGHYPGVFAYRFQIFWEFQNGHYWALLLWDRIIVTAAFVDPVRSNIV